MIEIQATGDTTLHTAGKYCEEDILIKVPVGGSVDINDFEDGLVYRTLKEYTNNRVDKIGVYAFYSFTSLTSVNFPACKQIDQSAFYHCINLSSVSFPVCTTISSYAFYNCGSLKLASFPSCTRIYSYAFRDCHSLKSIYLTASTRCSLSNSNAFSGTDITSTTGSIYVPASLVSSYKTATNWAYFSNRIFGV